MRTFISKTRSGLVWLRCFLTRNQIFSQTFSWIAIGGSSLYIAILGYSLNQRKLLLDETKAKPLFNVRRDLERDDKSALYEDDILKIDNEGDAVTRFAVEPTTVLVVARGDGRMRRIPVIYYLAKFNSQNLRGNLVTLMMPGNNKAFAALMQEIIVHNRAADYAKFIDLKLRTYLNVSYRTTLGESERKCIVVESGYSNNEVDVSKCLAVERLTAKALAVDIAEMNLERLTEILKSEDYVQKGADPVD